MMSILCATLIQSHILDSIRSRRCTRQVINGHLVEVQNLRAIDVVGYLLGGGEQRLRWCGISKRR